MCTEYDYQLFRYNKNLERDLREVISMNNKNWDALMSVAKYNKSVVDSQKMFSTEMGVTINGTVSILKKMQSHPSAEIGRTFANISGTKVGMPNLASKSAIMQLNAEIGAMGATTQKITEMFKPTKMNMIGDPMKGTEMFKPAKMNMIGGSMKGTGALLKELQPNVLGVGSSIKKQEMNFTRINVSQRAIQKTYFLLKDVQPGLAMETNQSIANLVRGVNTNALARSGEKFSMAGINPSLIGSAYKGVTNLLRGINPDTSSFFTNVAKIPSVSQLNITENSLKAVSNMLKGMEVNQSETSNRATSSYEQEDEEVAIQEVNGATSISMDEMVSILKSIDDQVASIANMCNVLMEKISENLEEIGKSEEPEHQMENKPLITAEEFNEALNESFCDKESFQRRAYNWHEEKKQQYYFIYIVLTIIIEIFVMPYLQENVGMRIATKVVSTIKELPRKESKITGTLEVGAEAIIMENNKYYYKITYIDENGEETEGYVAKRNVKFIEDSEIEEKP